MGKQSKVGTGFGGWVARAINVARSHELQKKWDLAIRSPRC